MRFAKSATRIYAQVKKEILQIVRRPGAFLSLVVGPFAIMALFGLGYSGVRPPVQAVLVLPESLAISRDASYYQGLAGPALQINRVDNDPEQARAELVAQLIDLVVIAPSDAVQALREGRRAELGLEYNEIDPGVDAYLHFLSQTLSAELNKEILTKAAERGETWILQAAGGAAQVEVPPSVIAAPTVAVTRNVAPTQPPLIAFFAPAVLALVLQHMAVTLSALSFVRERENGAMELFRISPVTSLELLLGKVIGFGIIGTVIAVAVTAGAVNLVHVPILGSIPLIAGVVALVVLASLGLGLLISVVAGSERQAVQLSLLLLLASVFFSGFVLRVEDFATPVQAVAYALPVTHGIRLLQDLMLRGGTTAGWELAALAGTAVALLLITTILLRRVMARG
ncbi:MAG: type transport system permease protein [Chloroflexota bacterium]|jgi:ABC-2 type transport system permease protein|nr:type transport system permease protein [Chloroflexota bacterium]